jgi:hypothetical protein
MKLRVLRWISSCCVPLAAAAILSFLIHESLAQTGAPVVAGAAVPGTVQLPTFHFFTNTGTVVVPDGGDAFLGGVSSSAAGRVDRGIPGLPSRPFTNNAIGSSTAAGNVSVSAQIHDLEAMDQALLGQAVSSDSVRLPLARPQQLAAAKQNGQALQSVAAIKAQMAAEDAAKDQRAATDLERGRQQIAAGKPGVAKIYFQSAAKQAATGSDVQKQALAGLQQVEAKGKVAGQ